MTKRKKTEVKIPLSQDKQSTTPKKKIQKWQFHETEKKPTNAYGRRVTHLDSDKCKISPQHIHGLWYPPMELPSALIIKW